MNTLKLVYEYFFAFTINFVFIILGSFVCVCVCVCVYVCVFVCVCVCVCVGRRMGEGGQFKKKPLPSLHVLRRTNQCQCNYKIIEEPT